MNSNTSISAVCAESLKLKVNEMAYSDGLDLLKPSFDRLLEQANYKNSWIMILEEDQFGLTKNAVAVGLREVSGNPLYFGRAVFSVDRLANNAPFNWIAPRNQFINRGFYVRKIRGDELVRLFGVVDRLYLQLDQPPAKTTELAPIFTELFNIQVDVTDIVEEDIQTHRPTVLIRFSRKSPHFRGEMLVDLLTKAFP